MSKLGLIAIDLVVKSVQLSLENVDKIQENTSIWRERFFWPFRYIYYDYKREDFMLNACLDGRTLVHSLFA